MADLHLVTGGAGFIGGHLVREILARGGRVRVLDNFATAPRSNLDDVAGDIELVEGDLRAPEDCARAARGARWVLHQAALPSVPRSVQDPLTSHQVNATGTLNLLIAARDAGVERLTYASSSSVYGPEPKLPREEADRPNPISPYAVSKLAGEQYCRAFHATYGLATVSLRYFNIFGPRQAWDSAYAAVLPRFAHALASGEPATVYGDGLQGRDFTYIANVVEANLRALEAPAAAGGTYNIGAGRRTTVLDLLGLVGDALGVEARARHEPPRIGDVRDSQASIAAAQRDLGYAVTVDVEEGVRRTVHAYLATARA